MCEKCMYTFFCTNGHLSAKELVIVPMIPCEIISLKRSESPS